MTRSQSYDGDIRELAGPARAVTLAGPARAVTLAALVEDLGDPDSEVREHAYDAAARWVPVLDAAERHLLGDRMAAYFVHPAVQARAFAPLVLARIVEAGVWRPEWWRAFADWYPAETDLRGHDPVLGWVHAAAHGADLLAALARRPGQDPIPLVACAVARLLAPTDHVFDAQEDDRLAYALAQILSHPDLTEARSTQWLEPVDRAFRTGEPGPVPAWASNAMRTLRMLYVLADRGLSTRNTDEPPHALTHREAVLKALAGTLAIVAPYTG